MTLPHAPDIGPKPKHDRVLPGLAAMQAVSPSRHSRQVPQETVYGTTTMSPAFTPATLAPTSVTCATASWGSLPRLRLARVWPG